jgi:dipeptide/tripeptide permease
MFLRLPFQFMTNLQETVLVINTVILIAALIVVELVYSERPKAERQHLKYFFPLILVLTGLLLFAIFKQAGKS